MTTTLVRFIRNLAPYHAEYFDPSTGRLFPADVIAVAPERARQLAEQRYVDIVGPVTEKAPPDPNANIPPELLARVLAGEQINRAVVEQPLTGFVTAPVTAPVVAVAAPPKGPRKRAAAPVGG